VIWSVAAAVGAALAYAVSTIMQAVATRRAHGLAAVRHPLVLGGLALDGAAFLLSLLALDHLPLFVVQAIIASSLVGVVVLARVVLHATLRRTDLVSIGAVVVALVVLALSAGEQPAAEPPAGFTTWAIVASLALVAGVALAYRSGHPILLAVLGGLGYSVAAIAARGAHASGDLLDTALQPLAIAIVAAGAAGVLGYLRALEKGNVGSVAATVSVVEVLLPGAVGLLVLGDIVRDGWVVPAAVATVLAVAGCVVLATSPANAAAEEPTAAPLGAGPPSSSAAP
jgi:drug/metabolite transporter (DMT)-like permease